MKTPKSINLTPWLNTRPRKNKTNKLKCSYCGHIGSDVHKEGFNQIKTCNDRAGCKERELVNFRKSIESLPPNSKTRKACETFFGK